MLLMMCRLFIDNFIWIIVIGYRGKFSHECASLWTITASRNYTPCRRCDECELSPSSNCFCLMSLRIKTDQLMLNLCHFFTPFPRSITSVTAEDAQQYVWQWSWSRAGGRNNIRDPAFVIADGDMYGGKNQPGETSWKSGAMLVPRYIRSRVTSIRAISKSHCICKLHRVMRCEKP